MTFLGMHFDTSCKFVVGTDNTVKLFSKQNFLDIHFIVLYIKGITKFCEF